MSLGSGKAAGCTPAFNHDTSMNCVKSHHRAAQFALQSPRFITHAFRALIYRQEMGAKSFQERLAQATIAARNL